MRGQWWRRADGDEMMGGGSRDESAGETLYAASAGVGRHWMCGVEEAMSRSAREGNV